MLSSNLRWMSLAILATGLLSMCPLWASAQQSTAVCLSQFNWMDNSKSQSPCLVTAFAAGACNNGQFTVSPLDPDWTYGAPDVVDADPCMCNTVTYNLMAACSACQNRTYVHWSVWTTNCSTVYPGIYPEDIPSGTAIPHWAYQDVTISDTFNVTLAQLTGDAPESTATKPQATATKVTSTTLPASTSSSGDTGTSPSSSSKSNAGAIAGGAVGGVVVLAAILALITWFCIRRRQTRAPSAMYDGSPPDGTNIMNTTTGPFTPTALYDPSDPTTFPASPPPLSIHTSPSTSYQTNAIHSNLYAAQGGRPAYVPEL